MLYPQNGDRIVAVYFVTSFHPMHVYKVKSWTSTWHESMHARPAGLTVGPRPDHPRVGSPVVLAVAEAGARTGRARTGLTPAVVDDDLVRHSQTMKMARFDTARAAACSSAARPLVCSIDIQTEYIGQSDVTESTATIRSPFCGYNLA